MNQAMPQRRSAVDPMIDLSRFDFNEIARRSLQPWSDAFETWRSGLEDLAERSQARGQFREGRHRQRRGERQGDCGCSQCASDPCSCRCCVTDADLVVETRVGERRVVTLIIENHWRREREIELELSSWTKNVEGVEVKAEILTPAAFTLAPCAEAHLVLGVTVSPGQVDGGPSDQSRDNPDGQPASRGKIPDVSSCAVSYADLRVKGCDLRSIRIAVAILPRDCDAYVVNCACGCC
jgi:hypothetical protein